MPKLHGGLRILRGWADGPLVLPGWPGVKRPRPEQLDGDGAVEPGITGLIDFSHSACTKRRENLVRPELRTSLKRHTPILDTQL